MFKQIVLMGVITFCATTTQAGWNHCDGLVKIEGEWTKILDTPECRFKTNSTVGRRILKACPNSTECEISVRPLDSTSSVITNIYYAVRHHQE